MRCRANMKHFSPKKENLLFTGWGREGICFCIRLNSVCFKKKFILLEIFLRTNCNAFIFLKKTKEEISKRKIYVFKI
jgi:hypothetical protein